MSSLRRKGVFYGRGFVTSRHVKWPKRVYRLGLVRLPSAPARRLAALALPPWAQVEPSTEVCSRG